MQRVIPVNHNVSGAFSGFFRAWKYQKKKLMGYFWSNPTSFSVLGGSRMYPENDLTPGVVSHICGFARQPCRPQIQDGYTSLYEI
jgi:hypothetical protein